MLKIEKRRLKNYQKTSIINPKQIKLYLESDNMNMKNSLLMIGLGVGGTLLYQQIKNGNVRRVVRQMNRSKTKMLEDLEDMM